MTYVIFSSRGGAYVVSEWSDTSLEPPKLGGVTVFDKPSDKMTCYSQWDPIFEDKTTVISGDLGRRLVFLPDTLGSSVFNELTRFDGRNWCRFLWGKHLLISRIATGADNTPNDNFTYVWERVRLKCVEKGVQLCCILLFCLLSVVAPQSAVSEDIFAPLEHPALRYVRENPDISTVAHWRSQPVIQFVGMQDDATRQHALSTFLSLADAADEKLRIVGFPNDMFPAEADVSENANIFVIEAGLPTTADIASLEKQQTSSASPVIKEISEQGIPKQGPGCFARWNATEHNEILGMVAVIDSSLSEDSKQLCLSFVGRAAFGISDVTTGYKFTKIPQGETKPKTAYYADKTETLLALSLAAFCRDAFEENGEQCPYDLMQRIFQQHGEWPERAK